jgi:thiol:disulfide interchange protein DsbC
MNRIRKTCTLAAAALALLAGTAWAQVPPAVDSALRKNLPERMPSFGKIDDVRTTPIPGVYEVTVGTDVFYTDAEGTHLFHGRLYDIRARRNLTEEREQKLLAIDFDDLPLKDAFTVVRGNGKRKLAVFQDPNCGYCKRFEAGLQKVDNITVYMFLYPVLGPDSADKSKNIWCTKDKGKAWQDWMLRNQAAPKAAANCDTEALARNRAFGDKHKITGTPTLIFTSGERVPGAIDPAEVEKRLAAK